MEPPPAANLTVVDSKTLGNGGEGNEVKENVISPKFNVDAPSFQPMDFPSFPTLDKKKRNRENSDEKCLGKKPSFVNS